MGSRKNLERQKFKWLGRTRDMSRHIHTKWTLLRMTFISFVSSFYCWIRPSSGGMMKKEEKLWARKMEKSTKAGSRFVSTILAHDAFRLSGMTNLRQKESIKRKISWGRWKHNIFPSLSDETWRTLKRVSLLAFPFFYLSIFLFSFKHPDYSFNRRKKIYWIVFEWKMLFFAAESARDWNEGRENKFSFSTRFSAIVFLWKGFICVLCNDKTVFLRNLRIFLNFVELWIDRRHFGHEYCKLLFIEANF